MFPSSGTIHNHCFHQPLPEFLTPSTFLTSLCNICLRKFLQLHGVMFRRMEEGDKRLEVIDVGLMKWSVFFATIIIVKIFPQLLKIGYSVLTVLVIVFAVRPLYKFLVKK